MALVDLACIRRHQLSVAIGLVVCIACGVAAAGLRFVEFSDLLFKWKENAYASVIWTTLGIHLAHIITGTCENLLMLSWIVLKDMDVKHARDVRVAAFYWYWIAGIWLPIYAIVYWGPRFF